MKANVKWVVAALALSVAAVVALSQTATPGHWHRGGMSREPMLRNVRPAAGSHGPAADSDPSDPSQREARRATAEEQMAKTRYQIAQLALHGPFDESQVRPLASQQTQTMQDLIVQRARIESELIQVLTPDQKTKLSQLLASRQQKLMNSPAEAPSQATPNP